MRKLLIISLVSLHVMSCNEDVKNKKPILLGDTNTIVTESDSAYLTNTTEDISPTNRKSSESRIAKMMVQVDSLNTSKKLENEVPDNSNLQGFTINFNEFSVVFNALYAHAINASQDERNTNSVSYLRDGGEMLEMKMQINGLEQITVEERITVKLTLEKGDERYPLNELGKFTTQWFNLVGKNNKFISLGSNSLQFKEVNHNSIKNALVKELKSRKRNATEIKEWMNTIANTNSHTDAPCKLTISSAQWRIKGIQNGKRVQKLIQFDNL